MRDMEREEEITDNTQREENIGRNGQWEIKRDKMNRQKANRENVRERLNYNL